ncbi:hypothetical protein [Dysgonomonas sp. ZJ279]|uniref:hypothetical protein n=1 Tax=Dysgonomonas sp. ZJ279 TaxID=2709796 RepID=UPI0013E9FF56|nr:hypothetical protein [Dysgonomonas sp. ZJ279]
MKKELTITEVEAQIEWHEFMLSDSLGMSSWKVVVGRYNALKIKLAQMNGERPVVTHGKTDHII